MNLRGRKTQVKLTEGPEAFIFVGAGDLKTHIHTLRLKVGKMI